MTEEQRRIRRSLMSSQVEVTPPHLSPVLKTPPAPPPP